MTLPQFLNWLFGVIERVIGFFGDRFHIYINILETIGDQINTLIAQARNYLLDQIQRTKDNITNWVIGEVSKAKDWVSGLFTQFYEWVRSQIASITASIGGTINDIITFVNQISAYVNTVVDEAKAGIIDYIKGLINDAINFVTDRYNWIIELRDNLLDNISFLSSDIKEKISILTGNGYVVLVTFLSNPGMFILDLLGDWFLDIIGWVLASALGSTDDNLDLTPPWKKGK